MCECEMCSFSKADKKLELRKSLVTKYNKEFKVPSKDLSMSELKKSIPKMLNIVKELRSTYNCVSEYQQDLILPLQSLAIMNTLNFNFSNSAQCLEEIYHINKRTSIDIATISLLEAYEIYKLLNMSTKARWCFETASSSFFSNDTHFFNYFLSKYKSLKLTNSEKMFQFKK